MLPRADTWICPCGIGTCAHHLNSKEAGVLTSRSEFRVGATISAPFNGLSLGSGDFSPTQSSNDMDISR